MARELRSRVLAAGTAALALSVVSGLAWPYTVDDAYVLARYARRLAHGLGYTMNDGPPTDGVTGPLGLLGGVLSELAVGDPILGAKLLGWLCATGAVVLAVAVFRGTGPADREPGASARATRAWVTAALLASSPLLGVWAVAGLETGLAALAFTVGVIAIDTSSMTTRRAAAVGCAVAGLAWLRPETAMAGLCMLLFVARAGRRPALVAFLLAGLGAMGVVAFRLALFGEPLPLSAAAKPAELVNGATYLSSAVVFGLGLMVVPLAIALRRLEPAAVVVLVHLVAIALAGGDWMPGFRLLVVALPAAACAAAGPIAERLRSSGRRRWVGGWMLVGAAAIPLASFATVLPEVREAGAIRETVGADLADWVAAHAERVAMVDVGYIPFRSGVEVIDLGGITDPEVGRRTGGHVAKRIDPAWLEARRPDAIILHSSTPPRVDEQRRLRWLSAHPVEHWVSEMRWVVDGYRVARTVHYADDYFYIVLVPSPS